MSLFEIITNGFLALLFVAWAIVLLVWLILWLLHWAYIGLWYVVTLIKEVIRGEK